MKALVVTLILRDDDELHAAQNDVSETISNGYPMYAWEVRETTTYEDNWIRDEYPDETETTTTPSEG